MYATANDADREIRRGKKLYHAEKTNHYHSSAVL